MIKMYNKGLVANVQVNQIPTMKESGWSRDKPEAEPAKAEPAKPKKAKSKR